MALPATTLSPVQSIPFPNEIDQNYSRSLVNQSAPSALAQLANSCIQSSNLDAPQTPPSTMTPRVPSPPAPRAEEQPISKLAQNTPGAAVEHAANAGKEAAMKISTPLIEVAKTIQRQENRSSSASAQVSPTSVSSLGGSLHGKAATTTTAPAMVTASNSSSEALSGIPGPDSGRALIDPGITGGNESTSNNRSFTFPPPLDDIHTSGQRNHSLPSTMYPADSPRTGSGKRHKCPFCSTEFTRHHNLKSHLLTHSQEKPYECQQCNASFRRLHDLKRHTKLHTGEKPHNCPNCGRKFARGDALARHGKGPGGCAGRRPSFIEENPSGNRAADESMDGIEYTAEPGEMDDADVRPEQRATDPLLRSSVRQDTYRPNTYPGLAPPGSHSMYPSHAPRSQEPSTTSNVPHTSVHQFNAPVLHSGMTESPKPISPRQSNDRSVSSARAMSSHFGSGTSAPLTLPPPSAIGAPHPPGLQTFHPPATATGPGSHPGSHSSSHHSGSGASTREILGIPSEFRSIIADLESRLNESRVEREHMMSQIAQLRNEQTRAEQAHRQELAALRDEVERLKAVPNAMPGLHMTK